jgi:ATP-dependent DNA ligase
MILYRHATSGKLQYIELTTKNNKIISKTGYVGGKETIHERICTPKNEGKTNATTAIQQAIVEMEAKIKEKMEDGYTAEIPSNDESTRVDQPRDYEALFSELPKTFAPCKPISKIPSKIDLRTYFGQRKRDGHCILSIMNDKGQTRIYSRGIQDITHIGMIIPCISQMIGHMKKNSFCLHELTFERNSDKKEQPRVVASVIRKKEPKDALAEYTNVSEQGIFKCTTFDIMFWDNEFIGSKPYTDRHAIIKSAGFSYDAMIPYSVWFETCNLFIKQDWEGFILRNDATSAIHYTLNGKPDRAGSYKYKFLKTEDFLIVKAAKGTGGAHIGILAQFTIAQYDNKNKLVEYGNVGPGTLTHEELAQLTQDIETGKRKFPFGVEIEYQEREEDSGCLKFGQIQRIREFTDKPQKEYTSN